MKYYSRRVVKPEDLNPAQMLFGGRLLSWIDEEAAIFAACQMANTRLVTKRISAIDFRRPAYLGEVIEFGLELTGHGRTSVTLGCEVRNKVTKAVIASIDAMVFVCLDQRGRPAPHGLACRLTPAG
ncbi:acyl-CoA thioesterase [Ferrimonas sediminicola]|uniref:Acyl-CoA thioesterase n=1 Tax=Ferrimonas sediminicola TaxID=2569538 RepID=A0A4U1BBY4_9GAMM|nr:hotdog domain-containing protein [Ferrimonas sediminicola]TKB48324.1 acyl-CoA thioesterase [Ferrimonas sediminicola]